MQPRRTPDGVRVGGDARQRFHDARGYGRPVNDNEVLLAPVEAAYLLYRGDLEAIGDLGFRDFVCEAAGRDFVVRFFVYKDLRERGFYLRPAHPDEDGTDADFVVFERGSAPSSEQIAYEVRVLDERSPIGVDSLRPGVLAIADEEGEVGYVAVGTPALEGASPTQPRDGVDAELVGERVIIWDPPPTLYQESFFGQPLGGRSETGGPLQLSLVEAAYLTDCEVISLDESLAELGRRARRLEADSFDRRLRAYTELRAAGIVPKTGYKFGADFRLYRSFESVDEMAHSDDLVRVLDPATTILPHSIALDVRLAHGVGKRMVFALTPGSGDTTITWLSIERLTP